MGSTIEAFLPRPPAVDHVSLATLLTELFERERVAIEVVRTRGHFSSGGGGWNFVDSEFGTWFAEGPAGFRAEVFPGVLSFSSLERFGRIAHRDSQLRLPLRTIFDAVASSVDHDEMLIVSGGYGDDERANEIALEGGSFEDLVILLRNALGAPATSWEMLEPGERSWFLRAHRLDR
jgi:hypothetical protein